MPDATAASHDALKNGFRVRPSTRIVQVMLYSIYMYIDHAPIYQYAWLENEALKTEFTYDSEFCAHALNSARMH